MRRVGLLLALALLLPATAAAQDKERECKRKMDRCWVANNGDVRPKAGNEACNTALVCGWQTGVPYAEFACPPGDEWRCEAALRRQSERMLRERNYKPGCDPRIQRC
jgi:hypothetical protein